MSEPNPNPQHTPQYKHVSLVDAGTTLPDRIDAEALRSLVLDVLELAGIVTVEDALEELARHDGTENRTDSGGSLPREAALEMLQKIYRRKRYVRLLALIQILKSDSIRLITPAFLDECLATGQAIPCRQKCPAHAFLDVSKYSEEELIAKLDIFVISYCWLSVDHPDPNGFHLATIQKVLEVYRNGKWGTSEMVIPLNFGFEWRLPADCTSKEELYNEAPAAWWKNFKGVSFGAGDGDRIVGVFLDWTAMPQDKPKGLRTPEELDIFSAGLKAINMWYAHQGTKMLKLNHLPADQPPTPAWTNEETGQFHPATVRASYEDSGWTSFENSVGGMAKKPWDMLDITLEDRAKLLKGYWGNDWLKLVLDLMDTNRSVTETPAVLHEDLHEWCGPGEHRASKVRRHLRGRDRRRGEPRLLGASHH